MDRLNDAALQRITSIMDTYTRELLQDICKNYNLDSNSLRVAFAIEGDEGWLHTASSTNTLMDRFMTTMEQVRRDSLCAWFTKRGEPCHKERLHGSNYCLVHAEYFELQHAELNKVREAKDRVNVTRKGIQKAVGAPW